jgi:hypothetical protein
MSEQNVVTKPCVCQIGIHAGLYRPSGKVNAEGLEEYVCRLCGRTEWRQPKAKG